MDPLTDDDDDEDQGDDSHNDHHLQVLPPKLSLQLAGLLLKLRRALLQSVCEHRPPKSHQESVVVSGAEAKKKRKRKAPTTRHGPSKNRRPGTDSLVL